jgi:pimeloyl-ACP methyl ester carboxylesterase
MKEEIQHGHPRPRGARSFFDQEKVTGEVPMQFGSIASFDGTPIFYCSEGSGPPLVFCYGLACSALHWTYQIDYFRRNYRCIWIDYRGHQRTPIPQKLENLTFDALVRDVEVVLAFLNPGPATFLGHSMGVNIVLEYARRHPSQVSGMVLANGTARRPLETLLVENFMPPAFRLFALLEKTTPELLQKLWKIEGKAAALAFVFKALGFNRHLSHPDDIQKYAETISEFSPVVLSRLMQDYDQVDATPWLHQLTMPTLIISGLQDVITPPNQSELMNQLLPNSTLLAVEHGSHCTPLDLPELVNLSIERFLK